MSDDSTLLGRYVRDGDEAAFAEVVGRHVDLVYGAALRKLNGSRARAEDVTQEVFVTLARKAAGLLAHPTLVGWLYVTVHHAAAALMRTEERRQAREKEVAMQQANEAQSIDWNRIRPVLDEALQELKPEERDAVLLRFFEQRPFKDVGAALRLTEDAARMRTDRAVEKLRGLLVRRGIESTGGALALALAEGAQAAPVGLANSVTQHALAAGKATGVLALMASGKLLTGAAVALALVTVTGGASQYLRCQNRTAELERVTQERAHRLEQIRAAHRIAAPASKPSPTAPTGPVRASLSFPPGAANVMEALKPGLTAMWQHSLDGKSLERDAQLLAELNLSPKDLERYARLRNGDFAAITAGTFRGERYTFLATGADSKDSQAELATLLGPDRFAQLQDYDRMEDARNFANAAAAETLLAGVPLSTAQVLRLRESADAVNDLSDQQRTVVRNVQQTQQFKADLATALEQEHALERKSGS